jgi:hypothetical protein
VPSNDCAFFQVMGPAALPPSPSRRASLVFLQTLFPYLMERASKRAAAQGLALANSEPAAETAPAVIHFPEAGRENENAADRIFRDADEANRPSESGGRVSGFGVREIEEERLEGRRRSGGGTSISEQGELGGTRRRWFAGGLGEPGNVGGAVRARLRGTWMNFLRWWPTVSLGGLGLRVWGDGFGKVMAYGVR